MCTWLVSVCNPIISILPLRRVSSWGRFKAVKRVCTANVQGEAVPSPEGSQGERAQRPQKAGDLRIVGSGVRGGTMGHGRSTASNKERKVRGSKAEDGLEGLDMDVKSGQSSARGEWFSQQNSIWKWGGQKGEGWRWEMTRACTRDLPVAPERKGLTLGILQRKKRQDFSTRLNVGRERKNSS